MNIPLIRLELRKNGLSAASAAAAFLVTLPVCRLVSASTGLELRHSLDAALTAWVLLGVPLAAALIGASSGAAAASRDANDCEAILPPSPGRRAASAMAACVLLAAAFAAFVLATGAAFGMSPGRFFAPGQKSWGASFWYGLELAPLLAILALDVLAGSWALSRLIGHGVAGGLLGLMLTAAGGAGLAVCFGLQIEHHEWGAASLSTALMLAYAGAPAKAWAGVLAARWSERRQGPRAVACVLALLALPAALIWGRAFAELRMLDSRAVPVAYEPSYQYPRSSRALAAAGEGAVLKTVRGGILLANAGGVRALIPEQNTGLSELLLEPYKTWIHGAWRDEAGVLWVERYVSPNTELWRVEGEKVESLRMTDGGSFSTVEGVPLKHRYPGSNRVLVARAEDYFRRGEKAAWFEGYKEFVVQRRREAGAARVACAGKCLEAAGRRWTLPGAAENGVVVLPHDFGGRRAYLLPVRSGQSWKTVLCRADGSTQTAWPGRGEARGLPDGTLFAFDYDKLWSIRPDGAVAPPLNVAPAFPRSRPLLMRRSEDKAWLIGDGKLAVLDAGGRTAVSRTLPGDIKDAVPLRDGFLITTRRSAFFSDWDGNLRRVENPR